MLNDEKAKLRKQYRTARRALSPSEKDAFSHIICRKLADLDDIKNAGIIMSYMALPDEVDLDMLHSFLVSAGKTLCFPRCRADGEMEAYTLTDNGWIISPMGIREPVETPSALVCPENIDLIIIPCLAFDERCARLGQGGGYYDRYIPRANKAHTVAVAFDIQRAEFVPTLPGQDISPELIVTEEKIYRRV